MPPEISPIFSYYGRRGNQFYEEELVEFLCPQPLSGQSPLKHALNLNSGVEVKGINGTYDYKLEKSADGKSITLNATLQKGGASWKTAMTAVQVRDDLYEVTSLTFDNKKERLDSRWEMTKVLAHIGKEQLQKACRDEMPDAHSESGKFGKFRRFLTRCMPDNPHPFMNPPPC